jgi:hypothetical protein
MTALKKPKFVPSENTPENLCTSEKDADKKLSPAAKPYSDDSAEMFSGLITGDDHFHSRGSDFVPLWG